MAKDSFDTDPLYCWISRQFTSTGNYQDVRYYYHDPEEVVPGAIGRDSLLSRPMHLSDAEKEDLENFLVSLTDKRFKKRR